MYFCRYETRVDYIYCNENVLKEWLPFVVEHFDGEKELFTPGQEAAGARPSRAQEETRLPNGEISDHKAVIATLIKKSGK